jgi:hypothetical protein
MNKEFKDWLIGAVLFIMITWIFYSFNALIFPANHFNFLEWFGIIMIFVLVKTGIDSWNSEE